MDYAEAAALAEATGFTHTGPLDPKTLVLKQEVRQMCQANTCGQYGKRWSCPPGCGTLEELAAQIGACTSGILVQTVGQLEDSMDWEGMMEAEARHKKHFLQMYESLRTRGVPVLAIGAGCCTQCKTCSYPDAPCRFPEKMVRSMEAFGMVVSEACKANHLPYYYGPDTIAYTSCFLFE
ncbi:MAG: DUF2284 domain-containing protein [Eubacteriales bacterium]|nr:DUF2284 domain-containing protein [Eubacteriales bacterium]